jgi:Icc-related predicted phosphoesterase
VRALVVSDEEDPALRAGARPPGAVDLVVAAGDLGFDYLAALAGRFGCPGVMVPGNHDPSVAGAPPAGFADADGRVVDVAGLRVAGLGGCVRYRPGPNQWSQDEQAGRARALVRAARRRVRRDGRPVDVLLTHAPPRGCGDLEDGPHQGFDCLHGVVAALAPRWLLHGHIHPYGQPRPDRTIGGTRVVNVVGRRMMEL